MVKNPMYDYNPDLENEFLKDAVLDLKHGETTYIYNQKILNKVIELFNDLEVVKKEFYWKVKSKSKQKLKRGRPRKEVLSEG